VFFFFFFLTKNILNNLISLKVYGQIGTLI